MPGSSPPRPRVTWVFGATLDGRVAAPDGSSRWISSRAARADAHRLRATHDAVLVGSGAARTDDPHLGLRHGVDGRAPLRVVLDARGAIVTRASRVADGAAPTLVILGPDAPAADLPANVTIARVPVGADGRLALDAVLAELGRRGVRTLLVEGGPTIAAALLEAGLVDEVVGYVRAAVLGAGRPLLDLGGVTTIADLRPFRLEGADVVGDDVRIRASIDRASAGPDDGGRVDQPRRRRPSSARGEERPRSRRARLSARNEYSSGRL
jgi:diaminohydroxyphosphoribosylaminopyrimidine deaminase / 5-amino-6-(5-phosphoribosylamino)uracil reductase